MRIAKCLRTIALAGFMTLAGCGGGGGGGGGNTSSASGFTLTGRVVQGPVSGATVTFYALNSDGSKGKQLGTTTTDTSGDLSLTLQPAPSAPFLAEASGGSYVDETTGSTTTLAATDVLRAVLPAGTAVAAITPLTDMAAARALALAANGTPLATAVDSSNISIAQQYNVDNIVTTLPVAVNDAVSVQTSTLAERQYGLVLAGIAQAAGSIGVRPIDLTVALASDAQDGLLDGMSGGVPITVPLIAGGTYTLPSTAGTTDIQSAINTFLASANNRSGLTQMSIAPAPIQFGVSTSNQLYATSTVLPVAVSGQPYSATLAATGGTLPYSCALKTGSALPTGYALSNTCQITGTGTVLSSGTTMSIYGPFTVTLTDSASPSNSVDLTLFLTTVVAKPQITLTPATCDEQLPCSQQVAQATGGTQPYSFMSDSFAGGAPPLGMTVDLNGVLSGTPVNAGTYTMGVCAVDLIGMSSCGTTTVTVNGTPELMVSLAGTGGGTVASSPAGISCGSTCSAKYANGTSVTLTATPDASSTFTGWSGACSGTGSCAIQLNSNQTVTATFASTGSTSFTLSFASASCTLQSGSIFDQINYTIDVTGPINATVTDWTAGQGGGTPTSCGSWTYDSTNLLCRRQSTDASSATISMNVPYMSVGTYSIEVLANTDGAGTLSDYYDQVTCP